MMNRMRCTLIVIVPGILLLMSNLIAAETSLTGLHFIGYPSASYKDGEGFSGGLALMFYQYGNGKVSPYHWNAMLEAEASTEGKKEIVLFWDQIHSHNRLTLNTGYKRYLADDYLGMGNRSQYLEGYTEPEHPDFKDELYYTYKRDLAFITADVQWPGILPRSRLLTGIGIKYVNLPQIDHVSKFTKDAPTGIQGGFVNYLRVGIVLDTRNDEAAPAKGVWSECLFEVSHRVLASDYRYGRITMTDRRYWTLTPNVVYAQRILFECMPGDPPYYEMTTLAGSYEAHHGLGGATSLRGVPRYLFVGPHKWVMNFELRAEWFDMIILRQPLTFFIQPFLDAGRVWKDFHHIERLNLHTAYGCSFNVRWKKDAIYSLTLGRSAYSELAVYMTVGNLF